MTSSVSSMHAYVLCKSVAALHSNRAAVYLQLDVLTSTMRSIFIGRILFAHGHPNRCPALRRCANFAGETVQVCAPVAYCPPLRAAACHRLSHGLALSEGYDACNCPDMHKIQGQPEQQSQQQHQQQPGGSRSRKRRKVEKPTIEPLAPPPPASEFPKYESKDYFRFEVLHQSSRSAARVGRIHTPHGVVDTPGFVAVGTNAALKAVDGGWADAGQWGQRSCGCRCRRPLQLL